ncbi:hypothetical protein Daus18300_011007 [Diaporthe australafricana]|uniref:Uncharacterized protein n=1 Tax=Diaporthe australafricana TaxID=127596 RepID=A0ABR3W835_9PEZI
MAVYEPLQKLPPRRNRWSSTWWWEEIVSIIASIGCMVAVVAILKMMQDKPTDHWTFFASQHSHILPDENPRADWKYHIFQVSLNAMIAVFITAAKSTAMLSVAACIGQSKWVFLSSKSRKLSDIDIIEEAARGPLGSIAMLARVPWGVATLGAFVTVLALGIDTFAQQVISTEAVTDWVDDGTASFGLARDYFGGARITAGGGPWVADPYTVDTSMQGAVLKAFYELDTPAVFSCASNCSWDQSYISLGFSTSCTNVSSPRLSANFVRLAAFRQPSEYRGGSDTAVEQTLECDIGLVAYKYTNASSITNNFTLGDVQKITLDDGYYNDQVADPDSHILFNTTGLPEFRVRTLDLSALLDYYVSDSFSGTLVDGEEMPVVAAGITTAIRSPQKNISEMLDSMALSMTDQLRTNYNATARGRTARAVVLVRVQWAWLALPFFVVLASGLFLIAEMVESRRTTDIRLWKSTATSLLFHSVSPDEGIMRTGMAGPEQLHRVAKATKIRLEIPSQSDQVLLNHAAPYGQVRHVSTSGN